MKTLNDEQENGSKLGLFEVKILCKAASSKTDEDSIASFQICFIYKGKSRYG